MFPLCHHPRMHLAPSNYITNFIDTVYLVRTARLWNALALTIGSIKHINTFDQEHFLINFDSNSVCSFLYDPVVVMHLHNFMNLQST